MPLSLSYAELERFYQRLVSRARRNGVTCAITSGMACVEFGVSQTTKDCDLLCSPDSAQKLLELLNKTALPRRHFPNYRGHLSPPLHELWLRGGWTSHFVWKAEEAEAYLDVFGIAPRGSSPWESEFQGFYAGMHTVAEMKHTNRERDWPLVTALGARLLQKKDPRGWLHVYDQELLQALTRETRPPAEFLKKRPVLRLAITADSELRSALHAEIQFWHELDQVRLGIYQRAVRPYLRAVKKSRLPVDANLALQHEMRLRCAEEFLPTNPIGDFGISRMIENARDAVSQLVNPAALRWLPDPHVHFKLLTQ